MGACGAWSSRSRSRASGRGFERAALLLVAIASLGCAPTQQIPLQVEPRPVAVYVDGERLEGDPAHVELAADRAHVLLLRRDGYKTEQVVLESRTRDGRPVLEPAEVVVTLVPDVPARRQIVIETEE